MRTETTSTTSLVKRRRLTSSDPMEAHNANAKLADMAEKLGREIRVFMTSASSPAPQKVPTQGEESEDFYDFTNEDYFRILNTKKEDKYLKTRKIREAEEAERRSRLTKAAIRVRFPDNYTLEVKFHSSDTFQSLIDILMKVIARPDIPFYIYTTPPKKQIKDFSQDFYSAGFVPGAIVYFSYDLVKVNDNATLSSGPYLRDEIQSLNGLDLIPEPAEPVDSAPEPAVPAPSDVQDIQPRPAGKKTVAPKWFKR